MAATASDSHGAGASKSASTDALERGDALESAQALARAARGGFPRKKLYRVRAHCNPLAAGNCPRPLSPSSFAWDSIFERPGADLTMVSQAQIDAIEWPTDDDADAADAPPQLPAAAATPTAADSAAHTSAVDGVPAPGWIASGLAALPPPAEVPPVDILDIGAGFGGLLFGLNHVFPGARKLGLEIRQRVAEFVRLKILASRVRGDEAARRCAVLRVNAMRQLHSFLPLGTLSMIFICFPDPHFKRQNHRRRIVSPALLSEYAALLRPGGILWTITDVPALHAWMRDHLCEHPSFREKVVDERDPCVQAMRTATDEARKSMREGRTHEYNAFVKVTDEEADAEAAKLPFFDGYYGGIAFPRTAKGTNDAPEMFNWTVKEREAEAKKAKLAATDTK